MAQQSIPYSADVFHHKPRSPLTLALLKRREYLGMLPHRGLTGKLEGAVTQEDGLVMHVVQDFSQTSIFTPLGQQAMEGAIGPNVIRFITLLQVLPSGIDGRVQRSGGTPIKLEVANHARFKSFTQFVNLSDVLNGKINHEGAPSGQYRNQTFSFEAIERLPDRRLANTKAAGEILLGEALTAVELAGNDLCLDGSIGLLSQVFRYSQSQYSSSPHYRY